MTENIPDNKLNNIEETLAHQEQQIQDLNEIVTRQWDEIELLKRHMTRMQDKMGELEEGASPSEGVANEKPPHY